MFGVMKRVVKISVGVSVFLWTPVDSMFTLCKPNEILNFVWLNHWFSTGGPQHVSRMGHRRLRTLIMGLQAE